MVSSSVAYNADNRHPFLNGDLVLDLSNGVTNTLQTVAGVQSHFDQMAFTQNDWKPCNDLTVSIDIKNELHSGQIRFHFSKEALSEMIQMIFKEGKIPNNTEITDCLGEISNICSGYAKTKLNEKGFNIKTALPSSASKTEDFPQLKSEHPNVVIPFKVLNQNCQMQIIITK